jgi:hypothetical protein
MEKRVFEAIKMASKDDSLLKSNGVVMMKTPTPYETLKQFPFPFLQYFFCAMKRNSAGRKFFRFKSAA